MNYTQNGNVKAKKKSSNDKDTDLVALEEATGADAAGELPEEQPHCSSGLDVESYTGADECRICGSQIEKETRKEAKEGRRGASLSAS